MKLKTREAREVKADYYVESTAKYGDLFTITGSGKPFSFGVNKAKAILNFVEELKVFAETCKVAEPQPTAKPEVDLAQVLAKLGITK